MMSDLAEMRKVLVLYTGGTIGMQKNHNGVYAPVPEVFASKVKTCQELHDYELARIYSIRDHELITKALHCNKVITYQIQEYQPLLASSNMTAKEWITIAETIEKNYHDFDGFVILQGTDTMAYTSSVLSFMFKNLNKPIILTGSQIPIFETPSDAKNNFLYSLVFASCSDIPEVCVFFANRLLRGNRVKKVHNSQIIAFETPNYHILAETGLHVKMYRNFMLPKMERGMLSVFTNLCTRVGILHIFPTLSRTQLLSFLEPTLEGVVLITYGVGNIPSDRQDLIDVLRNAVGRGVTVVNVTQCLRGSVAVLYETGHRMEEIGIIPCYDITVEAAYTKLMVICGMEKKSEERAELMKQVMRGEMTIQPY
ncbi:60 kDa lysophospholipase-like isoform X2 [Sitophilus oryzae]|nr:60 kDa lysophospholipase-like isoform X2 [Sitophilus oryzae]